MPITVICPACGGKTPAAESTLGKRTKCPKCGVNLRIPDTILAMVVETPPAAVSPPSPPVPVRVPVPVPVPDDLEALDELDPTPLPQPSVSLPPPPPPVTQPRVARPVSRPVAPSRPAPVIQTIEDEPETATATADGEFNPFAGFVVPGSAAETMNRDAKKKRR